MENEDRSAVVAVLHDLVKQLQELESLVKAYRSEMERKASEEDRRATERARWFKRLYDDDECMRMATRARDRERAEELEKKLSSCKYVGAFRRSHGIPEGGFRRHDDIIAWFLDRGLPDALSYEEQVIPWVGRDSRSGEDLHFNPNSFHFLAHCFEEELGEFISRLLLKEYGLRERWYFPLRVYVVTGKLDGPQTKIPEGTYSWLPEFVKKYSAEVALCVRNSGVSIEKARQVIDGVPKEDYKRKRDWRAAVCDALYVAGYEEGCLRERPLYNQSWVYQTIRREMIRRNRLAMERGIDWRELEWKPASDENLTQ